MARFEGLDQSRIDEDVAEMKRQTISLAFCGSEGDAQRADQALNAMSPDQGQGRRVGAAEIYEVVLDESFG